MGFASAILKPMLVVVALSLYNALGHVSSQSGIKVTL